MNKTYISVLVTALVLVAGSIWYFSKVQKSGYFEPMSSVLPTEAVFSGTVQVVRDARPVDGSLDILVDGKWTEIAVSGQVPVASIGSVEGLVLDSIAIQSNVGKKVSVYAKRSNVEDPRSFTLVGNTKYYVRVAP